MLSFLSDISSKQELNVHKPNLPTQLPSLFLSSDNCPFMRTSDKPPTEPMYLYCPVKNYKLTPCTLLSTNLNRFKLLNSNLTLYNMEFGLEKIGSYVVQHTFAHILFNNVLW